MHQRRREYREFGIVARFCVYEQTGEPTLHSRSSRSYVVGADERLWIPHRGPVRDRVDDTDALDDDLCPGDLNCIGGQARGLGDGELE